MEVNGITTNTYGGTGNTNCSKNSAVDTKQKESTFEESAVVYEKTSDTKKVTYKQDTATLEQLKADTERRNSQLRNLVEKLLLSQGKVFDESKLYDYLQSDDLTVDPETVKQAQSDIAEDGYWGVEQTSDRLVSFAKALTGANPEKIDDMIAAIQTGFDQATKAWGGELPDICKDTLNATMDKLNQWKYDSTTLK